MVLNLEKNQSIGLNLEKNGGLKEFSIGCGWNPNQYRIEQSGSSQFDIDLFAIIKNEYKIDAVYFNNKNVNGIRLSGDNLTGAVS